jgi:hypothetical protein
MATLDPVWEKRWADLNNALTTTARRYESLTVARMPTIYSLLKCLQAFGESQFRFFHTGLSDNGSYSLVGCRTEYALSVILDQVATDLNCIQLAAAQRLFANENSTWHETLEKADRFAWRCLPYTEQGSDKTDTTVVTYFQKFPSIRVIPYAPVALIGIPFSCISVDRDYLAIPHEVGHYMYWHKFRPQFQVEGMPDPAKDDKDPANIVYRWAEEIFADVYGCLIAGPVIAADFQDLQLRFSDEDFLADDDEHPIPAIRPMIYQRILEALEERKPKLTTPYALNENELPTLDNRWQQKLNERNLEPVAGSTFSVKKTVPNPEQPTGVSFPDIDKVIQAALKVLFEDSQAADGKIVPILSQRWWVNTPPQDQDSDNYVRSLYKEFEKNLALMDTQQPRELVVEEAETELSGEIAPIVVPAGDLTPNSPTEFAPRWLKWVKDNKLLSAEFEERLGGVPQKATAFLLPGRIESENGQQLPGWEPVLSAGGWATKGPHGRK